MNGGSVEEEMPRSNLDGSYNVLSVFEHLAGNSNITPERPNRHTRDIGGKGPFANPHLAPSDEGAATRHP